MAVYAVSLAATAEVQAEQAAKHWYLQKPTPGTQVQKTSAERGINPCNTPDPGPGPYSAWRRISAISGQMIVPRALSHRQRDVDVMIHFHGHEPARKEWVRAMSRAVLVGITLGEGSGPYEAAYRMPGSFERLLDSIADALGPTRDGARRRIRRVGLSAWSAGYGAVQEILRQPGARDRVDSVILLDALHAGYTENGLNEAQLAPFAAFARRAASGRALMFLSHSSIVPPGYASTTETANYLIDELGARPKRVRPRNGDPMGLELTSSFDRRGFHVRGFSGNAKLDHCAHLGFYRDVLSVHVARRWKDSRARGR